MLIVPRDDLGFISFGRDEAFLADSAFSNARCPTVPARMGFWDSGTEALPLSKWCELMYLGAVWILGRQA